MQLKESQPIQQYIKEMTEVFEELSIIGNPLIEEDRVVHLLASLPSSDLGNLIEILEIHLLKQILDILSKGQGVQMISFCILH